MKEVCKSTACQFKKKKRKGKKEERKWEEGRKKEESQHSLGYLISNTLDTYTQRVTMQDQNRVPGRTQAHTHTGTHTHTHTHTRLYCSLGGLWGPPPWLYSAHSQWWPGQIPHLCAPKAQSQHLAGWSKSAEKNCSLQSQPWRVFPLTFLEGKVPFWRDENPSGDVGPNDPFLIYGRGALWHSSSSLRIHRHCLP